MTDSSQKTSAFKLLPGYGFFGSTDDFALRLQVDTAIDQIEISVQAPADEFLNIGAVRLFGLDGNELDLKAIVANVILSSNYHGDEPDAILQKLIAGAMIHTKKEKRPTLSINLHGPVTISNIVIQNRNGIAGKRSRYIVIEASSSGERKYLHHNFCDSGLIAEALSVTQEIGLDLSDVDIMAARTIISTGLINGDLNWSLQRLTYLLPMFASYPTFNAYEASVCGKICSLLLKETDYCDLTNLSPLSAILNSDVRIEKLVNSLTLLNASQVPTREFAITKHGIHRVFLTRNIKLYLDAIDNVVSAMEKFGVRPLISYGTLLGAIREGKFIPHDDDVDLLYIDNSSNYGEAQYNKRLLMNHLRECGFHVSDGPENFHVYVGAAAVDVFICWTRCGLTHLMMERFSYRPISNSILEPRSVVELHDRSYPGPANPVAFLNERYGSHWKTPDPYHEWPWELSRLSTSDSVEEHEARQSRAQMIRKLTSKTCFVAWGQRVGTEKDSPPKNSIPLIHAAIQHNYDVIEVDVRVSGDGIPILAHDDEIVGIDGRILVSNSKAEDLRRFRICRYQSDVYIPTLSDALSQVGRKDVLLDAKIEPHQVEQIRRSIDGIQFPAGRLLFCVYDVSLAKALLRWFPESVLLWNIGRPHDEIDDDQLDEAEALGMDGVMAIWPLFDQDFSGFMKRLRERNLKVLFYLHGEWPIRSYVDDLTTSLERMVLAGVDYITTTESHLPIFKKMTEQIASNVHLDAIMDPTAE